jgi:hypothetical protein
MRAFLANYIMDRREPLSINELGAFTLSDTRPRFYQQASGRPIGGITEEDSLRLRGQAQELISAARPHDHFVKTHSMNGTHQGVSLINRSVTKGAIYITRNPLDLVTSYASHFDMTIDQAIDAITDPTNSTIDATHRIFTLMGRWDEHVSSWRDTTDFPLILIRYEDLLERPILIFKTIVETLKLPFTPERLNRAIEFSSFEELSKQERRDGFSERPPHNERFFREGRSGSGHEDLTPVQIRRLTEALGAGMDALGYR